MNDDHAKRREVVRHAVVRYLEEHPRASDTAAGITERWLPESGVTESESMVEAALGELVEEGRVRVVDLPGGGRAYGRSVPVGPGGGG